MIDKTEIKNNFTLEFYYDFATKYKKRNQVKVKVV